MKNCTICKHVGANQCLPEYQMEASLLDAGHCWYFKKKRSPLCKECSTLLNSQDLWQNGNPARCNDCSDYVTFSMTTQAYWRYDREKTNDYSSIDYGDCHQSVVCDTFEELEEWERAQK